MSKNERQGDTVKTLKEKMRTFEPGIWDAEEVFRSYMPLVEEGLVTVDRCRFELTDKGRAFLLEDDTVKGTRQ